MPPYRTVIKVDEARGRRVAEYEPCDRITLDGFRIVSRKPGNVYALSAILSLLSVLTHNASAKELGMESSNNEGYLQHLNPGGRILVVGLWLLG